MLSFQVTVPPHDLRFERRFLESVACCALRRLDCVAVLPLSAEPDSRILKHNRPLVSVRIGVSTQKYSRFGRHKVGWLVSLIMQ